MIECCGNRANHFKEGGKSGSVAFRIEIPVPFRIRSVNAWFFPGAHPALVDCGIGTPHGYHLLVAGLREHAQDPRDLTLYVTHGHVDHAGNAARLRRDHGVPLHAPRAEAPFLETFRAESEARNDAFADALRLHGMPEAEVRALRADADAIDRHLEDTPIDRDVPDGERVVLGDQEARALRTPGHTPGSVCFATEDSQLLSGDTLLEHITSNAIELLEHDKGALHRYVDSVEALRRFVGYEALPGHRAPFRITDGILDRHLQRHRERAARILTLLDRPRTAYGVMQEVFPGLRGKDQAFMAMAEVVGHLNALEIDGRARPVEDGVRRFART